MEVSTEVRLRGVAVALPSLRSAGGRRAQGRTISTGSLQRAVTRVGAEPNSTALKALFN